MSQTVAGRPARLLRDDCTYTACYCEENVFLLCERLTSGSPANEHEGKQQQSLRETTTVDVLGSNTPVPTLPTKINESINRRCWAIWISNENKNVAVWCQQRAATNEPVFWDYHVICAVSEDGAEAEVYDLDTTLPFPCPLSVYMKEAFRSCAPRFAASFRVVEAGEFLSTFSSDRSHMLSTFGTFLARPPPYECILRDKDQNNVMRFVDMSDRSLPGTVVDADGLLHLLPQGEQPG